MALCGAVGRAKSPTDYPEFVMSQNHTMEEEQVRGKPGRMQWWGRFEESNIPGAVVPCLKKAACGGSGRQVRRKGMGVGEV